MAKLNVKDSQFLTGTAGGAPASVIAQVRDGDVSLGEVSMIETTTITDGTKTMTAGSRDTMGGSITLVWDPAATTHAALMTAYLAKTLLAIGFKLRDNASTPADVKSFYGNGYITNISAPIASNGGDAVMECTVNFKLAGPFTTA
jgi:hypothetical protein